MKRISNLHPVSNTLVSLCLCDQKLAAMDNLALPQLRGNRVAQACLGGGGEEGTGKISRRGRGAIASPKLAIWRSSGASAAVSWPGPLICRRGRISKWTRALG